MRLFQLLRHEDVSGVSGTGVVAEGVEFRDGKVVLHWNNYGSIAFYDSARQLIAIHGHDGRAMIQWLDGSPQHSSDFREVAKRLDRSFLGPKCDPMGHTETTVCPLHGSGPTPKELT